MHYNYVHMCSSCPINLLLLTAPHQVAGEVGLLFKRYHVIHVTYVSAVGL